MSDELTTEKPPPSEEKLTIDAPAPLPAGSRLTAPVQSHERIEVIDILRGFAIFGILAVNMMFFAHHFLKIFGDPDWKNPIDAGVDLFIQYFLTGKFYTIFSFLFGLGLAVQLQRATSRGVDAAPTYKRRLLILLCIGLIHGFLIWGGDILTTYALFGFLLILFRKRAQKTVIIWSFILFGLMILLNIGFFFAMQAASNSAEGAAQLQQQSERQQKEIREGTKIYSEGSFAEVTRQKVKDFATALTFIPFFGWQILAIFLLGLYVGRRGIFQNIEENLPFIRKVRFFSLPLALVGNTAWVYTLKAGNPMERDAITTIGQVFYTFGVPAMSFFYISSIILVTRNPVWKKRLSPLANVGRMALSNYLFQSLLCTTIYYSYGLGLFGKVGPALGFLLTISIYLMQIPISTWWMSKYQFGPVEWLWRTLTYGKKQPMRKLALNV